MVQLLSFVTRLTGEINSQLFKDVRIDVGENNAGMRFQTFQIMQMIQSLSRIFICHCRYGEGNQKFIQMHQGSFVTAEMFYFCFHDRFDYLRRKQIDGVVDAGLEFQGIQKQ